MAGLAEWLGLGGGMTPTGDANAQLLGHGGMGFNTMAGLGMGLMAGTVGNPYGAAMAGLAAGSQADALNAYRMALIKDRQSDNLFRSSEAARAQGNEDRRFKEQQRQFNEARNPKPTITTKEDAYGNPRFFLEDPGSGKVQELTPAQAQSLSGKISMNSPTPDDETGMPPNASLAQAGGQPQIPEGVNAREYVKKYSNEMGEQAAKNTEKGNAGSRVIGMIDALSDKTRDPKFAEGAGPFMEYGRSSSPINPARWAYEANNSLTEFKRRNEGKSKEGAPTVAGFMDSVAQDVQAIRSELQRAYLSGQGPVTENERAQINEILGAIGGARNPEEARALLNNAKSVIARAFQKGYNVPSGGAAPRVRQFNPQTGTID